MKTLKITSVSMATWIENEKYLNSVGKNDRRDWNWLHRAQKYSISARLSQLDFLIHLVFVVHAQTILDENRFIFWIRKNWIDFQCRLTQFDWINVSFVYNKVYSLFFCAFRASDKTKIYTIAFYSPGAEHLSYYYCVLFFSFSSFQLIERMFALFPLKRIHFQLSDHEINCQLQSHKIRLE